MPYIMECLDSKNLEHYVLDELFLKPVNKHITAHLQECPFCSSRYEATKEFYTLFHHEVTHAIPQFPSSIRSETAGNLRPPWLYIRFLN